MMSLTLNQIIGVAFFFGMSAGLLISYVMVALVYRLSAGIRISEAAERVADAARQEAQIRFNEICITRSRAQLDELYRQLDGVERDAGVQQ